MRHVLGLGAWEGWEEGNGVVGLGVDEDEGKEVDWRGWMRAIRGEDEGGEEGDEEDEWGMETQQGAEEQGEDYEEEEEESDDERGWSDGEAREEDEGEEDEEEAPSKLNLLGRFGSRS